MTEYLGQIGGSGLRPEPPYVGAVYQARTRSGRRWEVTDHDPRWGWRLSPMGGDVSHSGGGGVKGIWRSTEDLRDHKRWRMIGVTTNSIGGTFL